jgi:hypothetical protein
MASDLRHCIFLFANLGSAIAVNRWNKFFFDALEQKDTRAVILGLGLVLALALFSAAFSVGSFMRACACRCDGVSG